MKKAFIFSCMLILSATWAYSQVNYIFSASVGTYNSLGGATTATLTAAYPNVKTILDESFSNDIPIGFTFQYNGINYTKIHLNANGFAALGAQFVSSSSIDPSYDVNDLRAGNGYKGAVRPILAPFWDNLQLGSTSDITYMTQNSAPNRVFTVQWNNVGWQGGASAISFQIKLYETSNLVDFVYRSEGGAGGANRSASIGITSEISRKTLFEVDSLSFISVKSTNNSPLISTSVETDDLATKPISGQVYRFTPDACMPPSGIILASCGTSEANLRWTALQGSNSFQYALSNVDVQPVVGTTGTVTNIKFSSLVPKTDYYFYIKSSCGTLWNKFTFRTTATAELPYTEGFENTLENNIPDNMSSQAYSNDFADIFWQTTDLLPSASGSKAAVNSAPFAVANTWLYTPAINLIANHIYTLSYKNSTTGSSQTLEVKYGTMVGEDSMKNIINLDNAITNTSYQTKSFNFTPVVSGQYLLGFKYKSKVNNDLLLLDDISLNDTGVLPVELVFFKAKLVSDNEVKLTWQTKSEINSSHFNIERSKDGINFEIIGKTFSRGGNTETNYEYYDRKPLFDVSYYRLTQVDKDGKPTPSNTESISMKAYYALNLYPNPSSKEVFVKMENTDNVVIRVFSMIGQEMSVKNDVLSKHEIRITPTQTLTAGIYMVSVSSKTETRVLKWLVL